MASGRLRLQHHSFLAPHLVHTLQDLRGDAVLFQQMTVGKAFFEGVAQIVVLSRIRPCDPINTGYNNGIWAFSIGISSISGSERVNHGCSRWIPQPHLQRKPVPVPGGGMNLRPIVLQWVCSLADVWR